MAWLLRHRATPDAVTHVAVVTVVPRFFALAFPWVWCDHRRGTCGILAPSIASLGSHRVGMTRRYLLSNLFISYII